MIVKRIWYNFDCKKRHGNRNIEVVGWFLFGFIPLYIAEVRTIG